MKFLSTVAAATIALAAAPSFGATLFSSGVAPGDIDSGFLHDPSETFISVSERAAGFTTADATVTGISWNGLYSYPAGSDPALYGPDSAIIRIYSDAAGAPALTPLFEATATPARTDTGVDLVGTGFSADIFAYEFSFATGLVLAAGDYWLSILNETDGDRASWAFADGGPGHFSRNLGSTGPWFALRGSTFAFSVEGTPAPMGAVPLPAGLPLLASAVGALVLLRRRREAA